MAPKTDAYLDTSALIAFLDKSDSFHLRFRKLFASPPSLVSSALVVAEGHGWFLRRYDQQRAMQFLSFFHELRPLLLPFDEHGIAGATKLLRKFSDQKLTLADAHGLTIIEERKIVLCWSTDRHFRLTGADLVA